MYVFTYADVYFILTGSVHRSVLALRLKRWQKRTSNLQRVYVSRVLEESLALDMDLFNRKALETYRKESGK